MKLIHTSRGIEVWLGIPPDACCPVRIAKPERCWRSGPSEYAEQVPLCGELTALRITAHSVPNDAPVSNKQRINLVNSGLKTGVSDLLVLFQEGVAAPPVSLELKARHKALTHVSADQWTWLANYRRIGFVPLVAFGQLAALVGLESCGYNIKGKIS